MRYLQNRDVFDNKYSDISGKLLAFFCKMLLNLVLVLGNVSS